MALDFYCHDRSLRHIGKVLGACFVLASLGLLLVEQDIDVFNYIYFVCVCMYVCMYWLVFYQLDKLESFC